jgi:hypothetical protein
MFNYKWIKRVYVIKGKSLKIRSVETVVVVKHHIRFKQDVLCDFFTKSVFSRSVLI